MAGAQGKTVVFFPEGAFGPTNNCVGIVEVLRRRGHRVIFVIEKSFVGTLEEKGFEERLMRLAPRPEVEEEPGQFWKDFIRETAPVFRKSTFDQLGEFIAPTWQALLDGARCVDERLVEIFDEVQPDAIVEDNVCAFPGHPRERQAVGPDRLVQPARAQGPGAAAPFLGAADRRPLGLGGLPRGYGRVIAEMQADFSQFCSGSTRPTSAPGCRPTRSATAISPRRSTGCSPTPTSIRGWTGFRIDSGRAPAMSAAPS